MAIDFFKALKTVPSSVFQRQQPGKAQPGFVEMAAAAPPSQMSSIFSLTGKPVSLGTSETLASSSPAIERAYLEEKNRAKQLADQDVLAKKYRVADLTKAYNTAQGDEKEKLGMEIFALTNPALAKKVKPGQVGYETIQATRQTNTPFGSALSAIPAVGSTNYQAAFTAPSSDIVSTAFGETTGNSLQAALGTVPELGKSGITFNPTEQEKLMGKMSISDAFTSSALGPSQENLSNLQLALLKEAFNKRFK